MRGEKRDGAVCGDYKNITLFKWKRDKYLIINNLLSN